MKKLLLVIAACVAISPATFALENLSNYTTADGLWSHITDLEHQISDPATRQDALANLAAATAAFATQFSTDPRHWTAKYLNLMLTKPDPAALASGLKEVAAAPDAPKEAKFGARLALLQLDVFASGQPDLTQDTDKEIQTFIHDFPDEPIDAQLQKIRLQWFQKTDPKKAADLLASLQSDPNQAVAQMAASEARMADLLKKPLDLKFTAIDGSQVDVTKLRGKVILVDFWATWCGPCMLEVPEVVETYNALHSKGLEIVGISLDTDKDKVLAVTKEKGMTWPQYFDGKGWQNQISSSFGINSIPRMFLVNKQGMIVDADLQRGTLEQQVEKLLTE